MGAKLSLTVGLPGCGKSTWANAVREADPQNVVIVERDELRTELAGKKYHDRHPDKRVEKAVTELADKRMREALRAGKHLIISDTNLNPGTVRSHIALGKLYGVDANGLEIKHFDVDPEECRRRNIARGAAGGRRVPDEVMDAMIAKAYENGHLKEMLVSHGNGSVSFVPRNTPKEAEVADYNAHRAEAFPVESRGAILVDVDGTLAKNSATAARCFHNPNNKRKDFVTFYKSIADTEPNEDVVREANALKESTGGTIVVLTGRDDSYLKELTGFLDRSGLNFSRLVLKRAGDFRPDGDFKRDAILKLKEEGFVPIAAFDDRQSSRRVMESFNIPVSQVSTPEYVWVDGKLVEDGEPVLTLAYSKGYCVKCGQPRSTPLCPDHLGPLKK